MNNKTVKTVVFANRKFIKLNKYEQGVVTSSVQPTNHVLTKIQFSISLEHDWTFKWNTASPFTNQKNKEFGAALAVSKGLSSHQQ